MSKIEQKEKKPAAMIKRDARGRLLPGTAGLNPKGYTGSHALVVKYAQQFTEEAMDKMVFLMQHAKDESVQLKAASAIINRGWGRERQVIETEDKFEKMSQRELAIWIFKAIANMDDSTLKDDLFALLTGQPKQIDGGES